jgi:hypothetical protein
MQSSVKRPLDRMINKTTFNQKTQPHTMHEQLIEINVCKDDSCSDSDFIDIDSFSTDSNINKLSKSMIIDDQNNVDLDHRLDEKQTLDGIQTLDRIQTLDEKETLDGKERLDEDGTQDQLQIDSMQRKTIYLHNDQTKPVTAAGALIYKKVGGKLMFLVIDKQGKYEDIGGKIEKGDINIHATVSREVEEETNGQIKYSDIIERVKNAQYVYVPKSKYLIHLIEANLVERNLTKDDFGNCETFTNTPRTMGWLSHEELTKTATIQHKMNWRLKSKSLMSKLIDVENQMKFKNKNLFKNLNPVKTSK